MTTDTPPAVEPLTLTAFLLARIAEDAAGAKDAARNDKWFLVGHTERCDWWGDMPGYCNCRAVERVLAECEAKRRIVEWHSSDDQHWGDETCCEDRYGPVVLLPDGERILSAGATTSGLLSVSESFATQERYGCVTLMMLALPYADHPDFREEWRA